MNTCSLCQRRIINPRTYFVLDCEHEFHVRCLIHHFARHVLRCPTCQERLSNEDEDYLFRRDIAVLEDNVSDDSGYGSHEDD